MRVLMKRAKEQSSSETKSDDLLNVTRLCELSYFPFQSYSMLAHVRERRSPNCRRVYDCALPGMRTGRI